MITALRHKGAQVSLDTEGMKGRFMGQRKWLIRFISAFLVLILFFSDIQPLQTTVYAKKDKKATKAAEEEEEEKTPEELAEEAIKKERKARKKIPIETNDIEGWPQGPKTYCQSGIMLDLDSGAILYSKNAEEELYPASITKVLTALVALENCDLDEKIRFSQASIDILGNGYASIGMKAGEKITMEDALYAMLMASANEVAYAICEHLGGGDYNAGVAMLNAKAQELGCTNSNFVNPNGIFDEEHYTTVHDMARIAQAAYRSDVFRKIISTKEYTIGKTNKTKEKRTFQNHHKMLWTSSDYYYEPCTGGKTGYTSEALNTLVTFAEKDGRRLLCVTMKTRGEDTYKDTKKILEYGFNSFQTLSIRENETTTDFPEICEGAYVTIPAEASFEDLDYTVNRQSESIAHLSYTYHGQAVGTGVAELGDGAGAVTDASAEDIKNAAAGATTNALQEEYEPGIKGYIRKGFHRFKDFFQKIPGGERKIYLICGVGGLLLLLIIFRIILAFRRRKKRRRRRRRRRRKRR